MKDKYTYLNYIDDFIIIINRKDKILFVNNKFIDFVNISLKELESTNFLELTKEKNLNNYTIDSKEINSNETIIVIKHINNYLKEQLEIELQKENIILNSTSSLIIEDNAKEIISCNKSFLNFFGVNSLDEFKLLNKNLPDYFLNKDALLKNNLSENDNWILFLKKISQQDRNIQINNKNQETRTFNLSIDEFTLNSHILCFNDITEIYNEKVKLKKEATIDSLTNTYNRRSCEVKLNELIEDKENFFLVLFDIDDFKHINDIYGHDIGDEVLRTISEVVKLNIRTTDFFARWGGEEFMLIFEKINIQDVFSICDKVRDSLSNYSSETLPKFSASFGISNFRKDDNFDTLFKRVDIALYEAKENGKNQIIIK